MKISEHYSILRTSTDDWFDMILDTDTRLFVDPFLLFKERSGFWANAHDALIAHFNTCFTLIAASGGNKLSISYKKAIALLTFREPKEMCLGYTALGTHGVGSGLGQARMVAEAIDAAIKRGLKSLRHFEELGIFNCGIGPDRISDMTCNILKPKFIEYTLNIAARHGIPTQQQSIFPAVYDNVRQAWSSKIIGLPINPFTSDPVLFVPARLLRDLPTLNAEDWWIAYEAEQVRNDLNYEVLGNVDKETIVDTAKKSELHVEEWTRLMETKSATPYDLTSDPQGVYNWDKATRDYVADKPLKLAPPQSQEEFTAVVDAIVHNFKLFIEENGGWRLLWNDDGAEKNEGAAQLLFFGIAKDYCRTNGIVVDREVELGRGPVDFKFSNGYSRRALLEVKKLHNGKFWDGLEAQLLSYCKSDECKNAWYLALHYRNDGVSVARVQELPVRVIKLQDAHNLRLKYNYVDAREKKSASKLTADK